MRTSTLPAFLAATLVLALGATDADARRARTEAVKSPVVVTDTGKASVSQFRLATTVAVLNRGWTVEKQDAKGFEAVYAQEGRRSSFEARIRVEFDGKKATITYVSSEGLDYADGQINANFNKWMDYLERDIPTFTEWVLIGSR